MAVQARVAVPAATSRTMGLSWPLVAIVLATMLRVALIIIPSHGYDSFAYRHWTWRLVHEPLARFYFDDGQAFPDHLPGDVWLLKLLGTSAHVVEPNIDFYGPVFGALISLLAMSFDAALAISLLLIGRAIGRECEGSLVAIAYWCAPAPIFIASIWGQIDGVSTALATLALGLAITNRFSKAFIALTLCVLVKPQFAMLALPLIVGWWRADRSGPDHWLRRVGATGIACIALTAVISAPFGVSLVGEWGRSSLLERVQLASDRYPVSVLGAHNLWIMFDPLNWPPDDRATWLFGLSRYSIGLGLFAIVVMYALWIVGARWRGPITMVLASNVLLFGFFLFMTRMHERYLFPVVALSLLLILIDRHYVRYAIAVHMLVFANIARRFVWSESHHWTGWHQILAFQGLEHAWIVRTLALLTVMVFGWLIVEGGRRTP